jgi:hypothetical protein
MKIEMQKRMNRKSSIHFSNGLIENFHEIHGGSAKREIVDLIRREML